LTDLRALVFRAICDDPAIAAAVGERIVQRGSWDEGGIAAPTELPYIVYSMSDESVTGPSAMHATRRYLMVWAHDDLGDYFRIDQILDQVKEVLTSVEHQDSFMDIRFLGKSPDLYDDIQKHLVRYSRFYATLTE
jgi:hypothetical protein